MSLTWKLFYDLTIFLTKKSGNTDFGESINLNELGKLENCFIADLIKLDWKLVKGNILEEKSEPIK